MNEYIVLQWDGDSYSIYGDTKKAAMHWDGIMEDDTDIFAVIEKSEQASWKFTEKLGWYNKDEKAF